ncbi:unnamed protein product [Rhizoctonia solani]|uniref:DUF6532 domain-containing protein n=1 Tax=Rhizoctonia solani TaxID=456999 RepID=A0A8H3GPB2_9AGAM|nr:unnamed protein product [Rhizoctonia solani]
MARPTGSGRESIVEKRDNYERRQNVRQQCQDASGHTQAAPKAKPRPLAVAVELPSPHHSRVNKSSTNASRSSRDKAPATVKGNGNAPTAAKGGPLLPPVNNTASASISTYPGPRPVSDDAIELGVLIEEWKRQRLIWYLSIRDKKYIASNINYDDLKSTLGANEGWDSGNEVHDKKVTQRGNRVVTTSAADSANRVQPLPPINLPSSDRDKGKRQAAEEASPPPAKRLHTDVVAPRVAALNLTRVNGPPLRAQQHSHSRTQSQHHPAPHNTPTETARDRVPRLPSVARNTNKSRNTNQNPPRQQLPPTSANCDRGDSRTKPADSSRASSRPSKSDTRERHGHQGSNNDAPQVASRSGQRNRGRAQPSGPAVSKTASGKRAPADSYLTAISFNCCRSSNTQVDSQSVGRNDVGHFSNDVSDKDDDLELPVKKRSQVSIYVEFLLMTEPRHQPEQQPRPCQGLRWSRKIHPQAGYKAIMVTKGMYETNEQTLAKRRQEAWRMGCEDYEVDPADFPLTQAHTQSMTDRLVSWHGKTNKYIEPHVQYYFFGRSFPQLSPEQVYEYIDKLKEGVLHTRARKDPSKGRFQNPILQICMNMFVFRDPSDIGVKYVDMFRKPSAELVAYFCSIIEHRCDRNAPDAPVKDTMNFDTQRKSYLTHLGSLRVWLKNQNARCWTMIQEQLFQRGFKHSQASDETATSGGNKYMLREEDVVSDDPDDDELAAWEAEREVSNIPHRQSTDNQNTRSTPDDDCDGGYHTDRSNGGNGNWYDNHNAPADPYDREGVHELEDTAGGQGTMDKDDNIEQQVPNEDEEQYNGTGEWDNGGTSWNPGETQMETDPNGQDGDDEQEYTQYDGNPVDDRDRTLSSDYGDDYAP